MLRAKHQVSNPFCMGNPNADAFRCKHAKRVAKMQQTCRHTPSHTHIIIRFMWPTKQAQPSVCSTNGIRGLHSSVPKPFGCFLQLPTHVHDRCTTQVHPGAARCTSAGTLQPYCLWPGTPRCRLLSNVDSMKKTDNCTVYIYTTIVHYIYENRTPPQTWIVKPLQA